MEIRDCKAGDIAAICEIYNHFIAHDLCTFEEAPVDVQEMSRRVNDVQQQYPWLVCEKADEIVGYAYATAWRSRSAYRHSAEVSVYVKTGEEGQGIGKKLYEVLLPMLSGQCRALMGGITLPNAASVKLHEYFGFEKVAHFKEVGYKFDQWVDVGYWQKLLPETGPS